MLADYPSLLVTKLYIPRLRSAHVSRAALLTTLDSNLDRKLILIAAAAGFGKTSLIAEWSARHAEHVGWLSLDDGDNDPSRFLAYLIAAIQTRRPHLGHELLAALQSPQPPPIEHVLHALINQLAGSAAPLILVLDDYHVVINQAVHAAVSFLLDHVPPAITLVILTRSDPPLALARLRAKNDLLELRAAQLRFTIDDVDQFLNTTMHLNLPANAIQALEQRTEGWIVGLQLAGIAMQSHRGDQQTFVREFTGSHHFVLDYLLSEVLSQQPEPIRHFLLYTSILHRLNNSLCAAVTLQSDSAATLDYLERNNLFLIPLDQARYWYRYHHLFADLLQARLQADSPDLIPQLHLRAAHWHEQNGHAEEAITYALAASDFDYAAHLITGPAISVTRRGEVVTLLDWYKTFPPAFVAQQPNLCLQFGMAFALNGRWSEAETLLNYIDQEARAHPDALLPGSAYLLAFLVASYRQDLDKLAALMETLSTSAQQDRVAKLTLGLLWSVYGNLREACRLMAEAQIESEHAGDALLAMTALLHQCLHNVFLGNLQQGYALCQEVLSRIHDLGIMLPMSNLAYAALGRIYIEWNELTQAADHLTQAVQTSERTGFVTGMMSSATMMLAEVKQAQSDAEGAQRAADEALRYAERFDPVIEVQWLKTYQARLWVTQGNFTAAGEWLRMVRDQPPVVSIFYPNNVQPVTQARVLLAQRKTDEAIALLTTLAAEPQGLFTVEVLTLLAMARQAQGDMTHALLMLEQALALGEPEDRIRVFLEQGTAMAKLLARFCESHPANAFAHRLLALFPALSTTIQGVDPLSEREIEVLRLIVAGLSNEEIAHELVLALSTVKWYINTLYGKLHVKTRSQAIARAHEMRLLND